MRIAYLVHNLADPAVAKRVRMLVALGDEVVLLGFLRDGKTAGKIENVETLVLGRTFDANFVQRITMVLKQYVFPDHWAKTIRGCDAIVARNLEMLVLAAAARRRYAPQARLAYECLDIHRLLLSNGLAGRCLRRLERALLRKADLLIVSSPAFLREYFEPRQGVDRDLDLPALVVENKVFPALPRRQSGPAPSGGPPWRIGWFGMIRCRRSLDLLCDLASRRPDLVHVTIRGRVSQTEFADFDAQVARTPGVSFGGAFRPGDLDALYGAAHFNWAIDYFEEGANSKWLLPNRIYEGGAFDAVPIALEGTETARRLMRLGIGAFLESGAALENFFAHLTAARYRELKAAACAAPRGAFVADDRDCALLLDALGRPQATKVPRMPSIELDLGEAGKACDDAAM